MIAHLRGTLVEIGADAVVVDCGGVGYHVFTSGNTQAALPAEGETVSLRIFTHALESKISLFGFASKLERALFDLLITVKKVGPTSAMAILSTGMRPEEIATTIAEGGVNQLTRLRGVGKKTAEMLVVELREKCELLLASWMADGAQASIQPAKVAAPGRRSKVSLAVPVLDEVAQALAQMGWRPAEIEKGMAELVVDEDATLESLVRDALRSMPR